MFDPIVEYNLLVQWLGKLVGKRITPKSFVQRLGIFLNRRHEVTVRLQHSNTLLDPDDFTIGGMYESTNDEQRKKPFEFDFIVNHSKEHPWTITEKLAREIAADLIETISHEYRHQYQYRSRKFILPRAYKSSVADPDLRAEQEYLGNTDEIDAYAYNIAVKQKLELEPSRDIAVYYRAFGKDHQVVKRLHKKIIKNLDNLSIRRVLVRKRRSGPTHKKR